jgi:hypothetical protein
LDEALMTDSIFHVPNHNTATEIPVRLVARGDGTFAVATTAAVDAGDISLGAVEIKDASSSDRVSVSAGGALKVDGSAATQPVSGPLTDAQLRAAGVPITILDTIGDPLNVLNLATGDRQDIHNAKLEEIRDFLADTLTVAGAVDVASSVLPTGAATAARQDAGNTSLAAIDSKLGATLAVSGTVAISGSVAVTGTFFQATQPVSAASLPLPSGAATSANQSTTNTKLDSVIAAVDGLEAYLASMLLEQQLDAGICKKLIDEASASVTYTGWALNGTATSAAGWRIQKIDTSTNPITIGLSGSNTALDDIWDNRAGLSYG